MAATRPWAEEPAVQRQIAIVEDEAAIRHNYAEALRRYNYRVQGYGDRRSALEAFQRRLLHGRQRPAARAPPRS